MLQRAVSVSVVLLMCLLATACAPRAAEQSSPATAATDDPEPTVPTVLILDASGSMTANDAPGPRIDAAKVAARGLIAALPDDATLGLQTYGTKTGSDPSEKAAGCRDVLTLLTLGPMDRAATDSAVDAIVPSGYTPISLALRTATDQLPDDGTAQAIVLVSDGEDTCGTPPCETAAQLKESHPGLTISTVGFKVEGLAADELRCVADVTGGLFVQAANANQLAARLLATQNIAEANSSLSATGMGDINLGQSLRDIRSTHPDFPDAATTGSVTVFWRDCDFDFLDGTLDAIRPHDGGRTIDGVAPGTDLNRMTDLYGDPVTVDPDKTTVVYKADSDSTESEIGYRVEVDDFVTNGSALSGQVRAIVLCRCVPRAAGKWTDPVVVVTPNSVGAVELGISDEEIQAVANVRFRTDAHGAFTELPPAYAFYESSTINLTDPSADPYLWYREISVSLQNGQQSDGQVVVTPEGFRLGGSVDDLRRIYGDRLRPYESLGLNSVRGFVLAGDGGYLIFNSIDRNGVEVHEFVVTQRVFV